MEQFFHTFYAYFTIFKCKVKIPCFRQGRLHFWLSLSLLNVGTVHTFYIHLIITVPTFNMPHNCGIFKNCPVQPEKSSNKVPCKCITHSIALLKLTWQTRFKNLIQQKRSFRQNFTSSFNILYQSFNIFFYLNNHMIVLSLF